MGTKNECDSFYQISLDLDSGKRYANASFHNPGTSFVDWLPKNEGQLSQKEN